MYDIDLENIYFFFKVSGRSSVYGDRDRESNIFGSRSEISSLGMFSGFLYYEVDCIDVDVDYDVSVRCV